MEEESMYTQKQVQEILHISAPTLYRYRKAGKIKSVLIGTRIYRYPKSEIDRILQGGVK